MVTMRRCAMSLEKKRHIALFLHECTMLYIEARKYVFRRLGSAALRRIISELLNHKWARGSRGSIDPPLRKVIIASSLKYKRDTPPQARDYPPPSKILNFPDKRSLVLSRKCSSYRQQLLKSIYIFKGRRSGSRNEIKKIKKGCLIQ